MVKEHLGVDEAKLIKACQQGQSEAGVELVDRYWNRVFAFAYRLTLNRADAEDIAQETFLRAFTKINEFDPKGQFKAWLLRIATNLFLDTQKSPKQKDVSTGDMTDRENEQISVEKTAENQEIVAALQQVIGTLSNEQRTVILLRAVEHMEYHEIAGILGIKETTVRWHMYEGRRVLWQKLSKKFDLEAFGNE